MNPNPFLPSNHLTVPFFTASEKAWRLVKWKLLVCAATAVKRPCEASPCEATRSVDEANKRNMVIYFNEREKVWLLSVFKIFQQRKKDEGPSFVAVFFEWLLAPVVNNG
jgi:hypothetical protein